MLGVGAVHAPADNPFPFALELGELGFVGGELGAELEALGLLLGNKAEEIGMSGRITDNA